MWLDRGQDEVNRDYAGCVALGRILASLGFSEKLLEGFEHSDMLCQVGSRSVRSGPPQGGKLMVAPAGVLAVCGW